MNKIKTILFALITSIFILSCKKSSDSSQVNVGPQLIFKFKFDSTQVRLDNLGNVATMPANHRGQSPRFNYMSSHYIELTPNDFTAVGAGVVLYKAAELSSNQGPYNSAIDFDKSVKVKEGDVFYSVPLSSVKAGTYKWLRVSLSYQNYDFTYKYVYNKVPYFLTGTLASFVGFNTHLTSYIIKDSTVKVNADKLQGYWGFESSPFMGQYPVPVRTGQAPGTTVVNPINTTSPIPAGSCLVTGQFVNNGGQVQNLIITGKETKDIIIEVSLSTNKSLEWVEHGNDNYFEPAVDTITDMGVRGMIPYIK